MSKLKTKTQTITGLTLTKKGSWNEIADACTEVEKLLESIEPGDIGEDVTEKELEHVRAEWEKWKPCKDEDYSKEMRKKTAEQSSVEKSTLEKNEKEPEEEIKEAAESAKKIPEVAKREEFDQVKDYLTDAVKKTGRALDSKVRKGVRRIEGQIYENIMLKANSLYFDNSVLSAVLSKRLMPNSDEKYEMTLHSNNSNLRELIAERINWDEN